MFNLNELVRPNIRDLVPYSSARDEFKGEAKVFLDANENSFGSPLKKWYNRYPDPLQLQLKKAIAAIKGVDEGRIFLGNGSDECIDILIRAFCIPAVDNIIICPPTYGMYQVSASINDVDVLKVKLTNDFQLDMERLASEINEHTKIIFLCSPNNPTGNSLHRSDIEALLNNYFGIVVIDEAYINFSRYRTFAQELNEYPNLVVMQTLSKAWGLAALRIGMAFASPDIISIMNRIKPPYNINQASQELALEALSNIEQTNAMIRDIVDERSRLETLLKELPVVKHVFPSDANFLLVKVDRPKEIYGYLLTKGIVTRDRSNVELCEGCLRITVGTPGENDMLITSLGQFAKDSLHA
jgi:histidinol-phosphate aminotransferase